MYQKLLLFFLITFVTSAAFSKESLTQCTPAKSYIDNNEPEKFNKSNNLLRKSGKDPLYCGQKIMLDLQLVDKNCVPISDAKIYIWQVGCDKKYPYKPLRFYANKKMFQKNASGSTFLGSGITTTNNTGNAKFITIFPPAIEHIGPYVNIRVEHALFGQFQTKLFLKKQNLIESSDYQLLQIRLVAPWENIFRKY